MASGVVRDAGGTPAANAKVSFFKGGKADYLGEVTTELKKVTWPNRAQLFQATAVVLIFVAVVAIYLGLVDALMSTIVDAVF